MAEKIGDEYERTLAFAKVVFSQIRALRQAASPRNYEVWYTYATGYNPQLNTAINEMLERHGHITEADLDRIHDTHFSPARLTQRLDQVGSQVKDEIDQVMAMIEVAAGSATNYTESLADVSQQLGSTRDREGLRAIVESLVHTAKEMEQSNQTLEARLSASKEEINQLQHVLETVRHENLTDPLTTLANRKYFDQALEKAIAEAVTKREPLSLMMTDIDHFKNFNDSFGHLTGDQVLRLVAIAVKNNVKGQDIAARYGGEEFAILLPNTVLRSAITVADHIRQAVMTKQLMKRSTHEQLGRITVSIGVATLRNGDTAQSLLGRADSCLYAAKHNGRNLVVSETDPKASAVAEAQVA
ncbi:MAG: diguanylate cyclase [Alphaproteobacteria bacterium]|jgi:diguanylate cyclase|nr:diguanylate cyclase [Alphaproteobacteria bacterium]